MGARHTTLRDCPQASHYLTRASGAHLVWTDCACGRVGDSLAGRLATHLRSVVSEAARVRVACRARGAGSRRWHRPRREGVVYVSTQREMEIETAAQRHTVPPRPGSVCACVCEAGVRDSC